MIDRNIQYSMCNELNYEAALKQLEEAVGRMERGEMNLDAMGKEIKNAQQLIKLCKDKLTKTEEEINAIIS